MFMQRTACLKRVLKWFGMDIVKLAHIPLVDNIDNLFEGAMSGDEGQEDCRELP